MMMKIVILMVALMASASAFTTPFPSSRSVALPRLVVRSTTEESTAADAPAAEAPADAEIEIPSKLPSDCGMDYVPLATMLATGQFEEADQVRES